VSLFLISIISGMFGINFDGIPGTKNISSLDFIRFNKHLYSLPTVIKLIGVLLSHI
jgi:hypothetical protein